MRLLNILWRRKFNIYILIVSFTSVILSIYPLLKSGTDAAFFSIDPDVVYVANALSYIKKHLLIYNDHPGIPSIYLLTLALFPIRIYAKLVRNKDFIEFIYNNYDLVFVYLRYFQSVLYFTGIYVFLLSIYKSSRSYLAVFLSFLMLLSFSPLYYLGLSISAETFTFLLISLWLYTFTKNKPLSNNRMFLLAFITGLTLANRATSIVLVFIIIYLLSRRKSVTLKGIFIILMGFVVGLTPSSINIFETVKRLVIYAGSSGIHGEGIGQIINILSYRQSVLGFWDRDRILLLLTILLLPSSIYIAIKHKSSKHLMICLIVSFTTIIFFKFPLAHYQITNYQFLVYLFITKIFVNFRGFVKYLIIIYMTYASFKAVMNYKNLNTANMNQVAVLEKFVKANPPHKGTIWGWARSREFAYLWTNSYGSGIFFDLLEHNGNKPIYQLDDTAFEKCWDHLYIQDDNLSNFLNNNKDKKFKTISIAGSQDVSLVASDHCLTKL